MAITGTLREARAKPDQVRSEPRYPGWRTRRYGPVSMRACSSLVRKVREYDSLSLAIDHARSARPALSMSRPVGPAIGGSRLAAEAAGALLVGPQRAQEVDLAEGGRMASQNCSSE